MDFIKNLLESKTFPSTNSFTKYNGRQYADMAFMTLIALEILSHDKKLHQDVKRYAYLSNNGWDEVNFGATDLAIILHITHGKGAVADKNREGIVNQETLRSLDAPTYSINAFLRALATGGNTRPSKTLLSFQYGFKIENDVYKSIRRLAQVWDDLDKTEKSLVITRMLQFFRVRMPNSKITLWLNQFARKHRYEIKKVKRNGELFTETTGSKIIAYHGSDTKFTTFDNAFCGSANGTAPSNMAGFHFTSSKEVALSFGKHLYTVVLNLSKVKTVDAKGKGYAEHKHAINATLERAKGKFDAVVIKNYADAGKYSDEEIISTHYVVFEPSLINISLVENATAGATSSGSIATSVGGLGVGFDNDYSKSIYGSVIKRPQLKELDIAQLASFYEDQSLDGSVATDYVWTEGVFDITTVMSLESWKEWLEDEIKAHAADGREGQYDEILNDEITDHIFVVINADGEPDIWDGNHRCGATAMKGRRYIKAYIGELK